MLGPPVSRRRPVPSPGFLTLVVVLLAALLGAPLDAATPPPPLGGVPLAVALERLVEAGAPLVYSSAWIKPEMRVETEPIGRTLRAATEEILGAHGLHLEDGPGGRWVVVLGAPAPPAFVGRVLSADRHRPLAGVEVEGDGILARTDRDGRFRLGGVAPGREVTLELRRPGYVVGRWSGPAVGPPGVVLELVPAPMARDEIVVLPARSEPGEAASGGDALDAGAIRLLPHLGDDTLRAASFLPGAETTEASSRLRVHGGRDDEVLILLDGVELRAPYHLLDFDSALSIIPGSSVERIDLRTDGFPAEYGDRMGGVLDLTTVAPSERRRLGFGLGLLFAETDGSGLFADDRGSWLAVGRAGNYELALEVEGRDADPEFWDLLAKVAYRLRDGHELRLGGLAAGDDFDLDEASAERQEAYVNQGENHTSWLSYDGLWRGSLSVASLLSFSRGVRDREGTDARSDGRFELFDQRRREAVEHRQDWTLTLGERWRLKAGIDFWEEEAVLDYAGSRQVSGPLAAIRGPEGSVAFAGRVDGNRHAAYLSGAFRPVDALDLELGVRYDRTAVRNETLYSPRFQLAWTASERDVVRLAWGRYHQSQRPDELAVEDGETGLARAEQSEHRLLGVEHRFASGDRLRFDAFDRWIRHPRRRFENLFDPIGFFPELEADRFELAPVRARTQGIDFLWRSSERRRVSWWLAYSLSRVEDLVDDGTRQWVPRAVDGRHALAADVGYRFRSGWTVNLAWTYHSGWPTTALDAVLVPAPEGGSEVEVVLGPLRGERLPAYHRLDLRVSRSWTLRLGRLSTYVDLQNLYDRRNVRGFADFSFEPTPDGRVEVGRESESWGGFLPSFGVRWEL